MENESGIIHVHVHIITIHVCLHACVHEYILRHLEITIKQHNTTQDLRQLFPLTYCTCAVVETCTYTYMYIIYTYMYLCTCVIVLVFICQTAVTVEVVDDSSSVPAGLTVLGYDVTVSDFIPYTCTYVHLYMCTHDAVCSQPEQMLIYCRSAQFALG